MPKTTDTPLLDVLLTRVRRICDLKGHGSLVELAAAVKRTPSQVGEYLTTNERKIKRRPNAEIALAMQQWAEKNAKS